MDIYSDLSHLEIAADIGAHWVSDELGARTGAVVVGQNR
jgi:hypothetical protein